MFFHSFHNPAGCLPDVRYVHIFSITFYASYAADYISSSTVNAKATRTCRAGIGAYDVLKVVCPHCCDLIHLPGFSTNLMLNLVSFKSFVILRAGSSMKITP